MRRLQDMIEAFARPGRLEGIWLRGARLAAPQGVDEAEVGPDGLSGDHARPGKRAVTLIQAEHLPVIAALAGRNGVTAAQLRRNLVVSGLNLNGLKGRRIAIGGVVLEVTIVCAPCSRMEDELGHGGYAALRGHGGWCAQVVTPGPIRVGDAVTPLAG